MRDYKDLENATAEDITWAELLLLGNHYYYMKNKLIGDPDNHYFRRELKKTARQLTAISDKLNIKWDEKICEYHS